MAIDHLAEDAPIEVGGIALPPGRLIHPHLGTTKQPPVMWATMNEVADPGRLWLDLLSAAPRTGLVPIVLDGLSRQPERPWDSGELDPQPAPALDDLDEAVVFKQGWNKGVPLGLLPPLRASAPPTDTWNGISPGT